MNNLTLSREAPRDCNIIDPFTCQREGKTKVIILHSHQRSCFHRKESWLLISFSYEWQELNFMEWLCLPLVMFITSVNAGNLHSQSGSLFLLLSTTLAITVTQFPRGFMYIIMLAAKLVRIEAIRNLKAVACVSRVTT
jgi:hypothetical protein